MPRPTLRPTQLCRACRGTRPRDSGPRPWPPSGAARAPDLHAALEHAGSQSPTGPQRRYTAAPAVLFAPDEAQPCRTAWRARPTGRRVALLSCAPQARASTHPAQSSPAERA
eukprot:1880440-Alexandrium_andersonii.AAC.1